MDSTCDTFSTSHNGDTSINANPTLLHTEKKAQSLEKAMLSRSSEDPNLPWSVNDCNTESLGKKDYLDNSNSPEPALCPKADLLKTQHGKTDVSSIPNTISPSQLDLYCRREKEQAWADKEPCLMDDGSTETSDNRSKSMKSQESHTSCTHGSSPCPKADVLKTPNEKTELGSTPGSTLSHPKRSFNCRRKIKLAWVDKDDKHELNACSNSKTIRHV